MLPEKFVKGFIFHDPVFDGQTLERLRDHPTFGPVVEKWITQGRTDWRAMKSQLRLLQIRARRQRKWLSAFEKTGSELSACKSNLVTYSTFYNWKTKDDQFKARYQALRELHAMTLVERARELAYQEGNATDRWNLIKAEVPDYNPKKEKTDVTFNFNKDIEFTAERPPVIDTTATKEGDAA